ncbi:nuclear transport factor 2 family protein [Spirosoma sp. BT702]|uniref:Nuclear transport factor 2 family protein n=1 Tax=Spirosoma profusum TaxID=2771354 RepID=A0A926Y2X6_9BACT|nr:nuclear transport factor 2 family protein [Spirosoma profusum]MBD2701226.1 nuclear transport factor 2 family protein [Spirosoma profusum]
MTTITQAKETVLAFIEALNDEDFEAARDLLADDMSFVGVMGTRNGGDVYIQDMQKMKFKYDIEKVFVDGDDVCLWYNIDMGGPKIFSSGWYVTEAGKVKSIKVLFDPRPLLDKK